jgi:hypothetical protein
LRNTFELKLRSKLAKSLENGIIILLANNSPSTD